ncbi:hypothetical protein PSH66_15095 [Pseudomonas sp. FP597]|uniref:hypothetical protein n=1 Tax=Pseudomonas sp. FP597 TaxID=2954096 RepID=UPI00273562D4|nr:hypothetical protein [Pseudomonas sp. FP597]WLI09598.1 hypothetical protein PSH66_15095 [Pseudomonas sp. FP597]
MEQANNTTAILTATGNLQAKITGAINHNYNVSQGELAKGENGWKITSIEFIDGKSRYEFQFRIPSLPDDGSEHKYSLNNVNALGYFYDGSRLFVASVGEITVTLKDNRMRGSFHFSAYREDDSTHKIEVSEGAFDLQNDAGSFTARLDGPGQPYPEFTARQVGINFHDRPDGPMPSYYVTEGRIVNYDNIPSSEDRISVFTNKGIAPGRYQLDLTTDNVRVHFLRIGGLSIGTQAYKGELIVEEVADSGHAKGSFNCTFINRDEEFTAAGKYDVFQQ